MKDKVKTQIQQYQQQFDELLKEREQLVARLNEVSTAVEQVRGAFGALKGLEDEDKPVEKKDKK
jgi:prefoldin subunit 5